MIFNLLYAESKISHLTNHPENCTIAPFINSSFLFFHRIAPLFNPDQISTKVRLSPVSSVRSQSALIELHSKISSKKRRKYSPRSNIPVRSRRCVEGQKIGEIIIFYPENEQVTSYKYRRENCIEIVVKLRSTWSKFFLEFCFIRTSVNIEEENSRIFLTSLWIFETSMYRRLVAERVENFLNSKFLHPMLRIYIFYSCSIGIRISNVRACVYQS